MKHKTGQCVDCEDSNEKPLIAGRCNYHYWRYRSENKQDKPKEKPLKKIAQFSKKRLKDLAVYRKKRAIFMAQNQTCQAELSGCTYYATDVHHRKGRIGSLLNDETNFIALCRSCHRFIEEHPEEAKELGLSESRLQTT